MSRLGLASAALALILAGANDGRALDGDASGLTLLARALEGNPHCVLLDGTTAYVGLDSGLAVLDVASPGLPLPLAHLPLPSAVLDLARSPSALLAAAGESGLLVIDVAVPSAPVVSGALRLPGARSVAARGTVALVGRGLPGAQGISLVDTSGPPSPIAFIGTMNDVDDIAMAGAIAWAGLGGDPALGVGLQAVDVSAPGAPVLRGFLPTLRPVHGVALQGGTAYLATGVALRGDLVVADVSAPASPSEISRVTFGDSGRGVALDGSLALVAAARLGLLRYDVSNPASPVRVDTSPTGRDSVAVASSPAVALLADRSSTGIAALTILDSPAPPGTPTPASLVPYAEATDIAMSAGVVAALRRDGLYLLDPAAGLAGIGSFAPPGADYSALAVEAGLAAIAEGVAVRLVDVVLPSAPALQGSATVTVGVAADVALAGTTLFVATGRSVEIFDVTSPSSPSPLATWDAGDQDGAIAVDGPLAASGGGPLVRLLDVAAPAAPASLGSVAIPDNVQAVALGGSLAIACGLAATYFIDVTDPSAPVIVGQLPGGATDASLASGLAFLASGRSGVRVVDVANPSAPVEIAFFDASGEAVGVAVDGASIALATGPSQIWWLDCAACAAGCSATASLTGPSPACAGQVLSFDATGSGLSGCAGMAAYRWFVDGSEVPGASADTLDAGPFTAGLHDVVVEVSCDVNPACSDTASLPFDALPGAFPVLDPASLRVRKVAGGEELSWVVAAGSGEVNVHRSLVPADLADAAIGPATVVSVATGNTDLNTFSPGLGNCAYFKVFGRDSCSGASVVP